MCAVYRAKVATGTYDVALAMRPPRRIRSGRRVTVFFNPGGPGGSAVDYLASDPPELRRLDDVSILTFDPPGTGQTSPATCGRSNAPERLAGTVIDTADPAALKGFVESSTGFARACRNGAARGEGAGSATAADVMEAVRMAVGEPTVNFLGFSYGTALGLDYVARYPSGVGRFVLDGVVPLTMGLKELTDGQAISLEAALGAFLTRCAAPPCPAADAGATARIDSLFAAAATVPMRSGSSALSGARLTYALGIGVAEKANWSRLETALDAASHGDPRLLLEMSDQAEGRLLHGGHSDLLAQYYAVVCSDHVGPSTVESIIDDVSELRRSAPHFAELAILNAPCLSWRSPGVPAPAPTHVRSGSVTILSAELDPLSPTSWAGRMHAADATSVLVTWQGIGHLAYVNSPCARQIANGILDGFSSGPSHDTVCQ
ncbi:MAG: alpha/beta fold hydrolase [Candidatus Dormibacteria bacterium]